MVAVVHDAMMLLTQAIIPNGAAACDKRLGKRAAPAEIPALWVCVVFFWVADIIEWLRLGLAYGVEML